MNAFWTNTLVSIAPFVALLALWGFLLRQMRKGKGQTQQTLIEPMRKVLQDEIVTEMRALRESIDGLRKDLNERR
ncbi:MAG TPA: hypothetical protein VG714_08675 [Acidobacteriaceae bacterium]|nr:hypothetical protein [Acidobacteriaceae bacterium]